MQKLLLFFCEKTYGTLCFYGKFWRLLGFCCIILLISFCLLVKQFVEANSSFYSESSRNSGNRGLAINVGNVFGNASQNYPLGNLHNPSQRFQSNSDNIGNTKPEILSPNLSNDFPDTFVHKNTPYQQNKEENIYNKVNDFSDSLLVNKGNLGDSNSDGHQIPLGRTQFASSTLPYDQLNGEGNNLNSNNYNYDRYESNLNKQVNEMYRQNDLGLSQMTSNGGSSVTPNLFFAWQKFENLWGEKSLCVHEKIKIILERLKQFWPEGASKYAHQILSIEETIKRIEAQNSEEKIRNIVQSFDGDPRAFLEVFGNNIIEIGRLIYILCQQYSNFFSKVKQQNPGLISRIMLELYNF